MLKNFLSYLMKVFNIILSLTIFIYPAIYFDEIWPLCITWLFGLGAFSYLDDAANKIENYNEFRD